MASPHTGGKSLFNEVIDIENGSVRSIKSPNVVVIGDSADCGDCALFGEIGGEGRNFGTGFLQLRSRLELLFRRFLVCGSR